MISLKFKLQMCFTFIFTCIMAMVYNFSKIFIISKLLHKCNIFLHLDVILVLLLLILTFSSFQNQLFFSGFPSRFIKLFHIIFFTICLFSMWSNVQTFDVEQSQETCSPIFVVEEFSWLFAHLFFELKIQYQHK